MFTGLVLGTGALVAKELHGESALLSVRYAGVFDSPQIGESIAVNGVCLTVASVDEDHESISFDVMGITLSLTNLGDLTPGMRVNLERAMAVGDRFGGHIVQGHIDGKAQLISKVSSDNWITYRFSLPVSVSKYIVSKGSICLDGVSLTVSAVTKDWFEVSLIPTTLDTTNLAGLDVGEWVNVEVDVIAKYVESMLGK
jgi:riboflavin synthase